MKFKITLPEQDIKPEIIERRNRFMFSDDLNNNGSLAKCFIFVYLNQPCTVTEITKKVSSYYKIDLNRGTVFRCLNKLVEKGLLHTTTPGDVLAIHDSERKDVEKEIVLKYYRFLKEIPDPFRKNFSNINFYWISNGDGLKYVEWCCKLLNFECKEEK